MVKKTKGMNTIHMKWVYKLKKNAEAQIERFKARTVACGNEQVKFRDYVRVFAPTLEMGTARMVLSTSVKYKVPAKHFDVPNAYVNADAEEGITIYAEFPPGIQLEEEILKAFGVQNQNQLVLVLKKSLYGLKQAGRMWNKKLDDFLRKNGFKGSVTDRCLYYKRGEHGLTIVAVYVDDLLVTGTTQEAADEFSEIAKQLDMKDLGVAKKFLGIRVDATPGRVVMDQEHMIDDLLKEHHVENANPVRLPISQDYDIAEGGKLLPVEANQEQA